MIQGSAGVGVEITVLKTLATEKAYRELLPEFEKASGHSVKTTYAGTVEVKKRIAAGEPFDLLMMASEDIDAFIASGAVKAGSRVDVASSGVGVAVRLGAPKPDIGTPEAFAKALLAAKSVGYSTGPSGLYLIKLLERMGLSAQITPKLKQVPTGSFVGSILADGTAELGIQQVAELSTFPGVSFVGPLPGDLNKITMFASGITTGVRLPGAARALVKFLTQPSSAVAFKRHGLVPA